MLNSITKLFKEVFKMKNKKDYDYLAHSASAQDCTGLIPSIPISLSEIESYESIYPFIPFSPEDSENDTL